MTQCNKANQVPRPAHSAQAARYVIRSLSGPYQPFTDFLATEFPRQASLDISFSGPELPSPKALFAHKQPADALNWSSSTDPYLHPGILMYALYTPNAYCPSPPSPFVRSFVRSFEAESATYTVVPKPRPQLAPIPHKYPTVGPWAKRRFLVS